MSSLDGPHFFIGPRKVIVKGEGKAGSTAVGNKKKDVGGSIVSALRRSDPVDPVEEARAKFAADVGDERKAFVAFLRASLASLDKDIVDAVVEEFHHHCSREERAIEMAGDRLVDATMCRLFPELRHFQSVVDVAQSRCSSACHKIIEERRREEINADRIRELQVLIEATMGQGAALRTASEIDLEIIGATNSLLVWLSKFRDTLIPAYREAGEAAAASLSSSSSSGIPLAPGYSQSSALSGQSRSTTVKSGRASKTVRKMKTGKKGKMRLRPSTAPMKRRHPPVGGGFFGVGLESITQADHVLSGSQFDIQATIGTALGRKKVRARGKSSMYNSFSPGKLKSRHTLKQFMGSYYSHDNNVDASRWNSAETASSLAQAVKQTPFFNNSRMRKRMVGPPLFPSNSTSALLGKANQGKRKSKSKSKKRPQLFQGGNTQTPLKTHMSQRHINRSVGAGRRRPVQSKSAGDLFDERNLLGRMATVQSLVPATPTDNGKECDKFDDYNSALSTGLDGGW